jgi:hypothetical protein
MEGAFTHVGNHLISDSAAAINAGDDDLSTLDPDETLFYGAKYDERKALGNARRRDDDDNGMEGTFDDDDLSMASVPVSGLKDLNLNRATPDEEKKLPAHACAYVCLWARPPVSCCGNLLTASSDIVAFTHPLRLLSVSLVINGSVALVATRALPILSTISSALDTRRSSSTPSPLSATQSLNAITVVPRMSSSLVSSPQSPTRLLYYFADSRVLLQLLPRT